MNNMSYSDHWWNHDTMDRYGWRKDKQGRRRRGPFGLHMACRRLNRRKFIARIEKEKRKGYPVLTLFSPSFMLHQQGKMLPR